MNQNNRSESDDLSLAERRQRKLLLYRQSNELADAALLCLEDGQIAQEYLDQINQKMILIERLDISSNRSALTGDDSANHHKSEFAQFKKELQQTIESLIEKTNKLENRIRTARENLLPKLNGQLVASKMQQAYSSNSDG